MHGNSGERPAQWEVRLPTVVTIGTDSALPPDVVGRTSDGSDIQFNAVTTGCQNPADKFGPNFHFDTEFFPFQGTVLDAGVPTRRVDPHDPHEVRCDDRHVLPEAAR